MCLSVGVIFIVSGDLFWNELLRCYEKMLFSSIDCVNFFVDEGIGEFCC